jgi:hypothetical protein
MAALQTLKALRVRFDIASAPTVIGNQRPCVAKIFAVPGAELDAVFGKIVAEPPNDLGNDSVLAKLRGDIEGKLR